MKRMIMRLAAIVLLALLAAGCAGMEEKIMPMRGPTFDTAGPVPVPGAEAPEDETESERSIMRIIEGTLVEGPEEAAEIMARETASPLMGMQTRIDSLIMRDVEVRAVAELLTEICGYNVVATRAAAEIEIDIYLRDLTLRDALEALCRLNNLWYREGEGVITLMNREEYVKDIEVRQSDQTRVFYVRYTNAADMAKVIQAAMGEEVHLEAIEDEEIYGHIDPEEEADVGTGEYDVPVLSTKGSETGSLVALATAEGSGSEDEKPLLAVLTVFKRNNCIVARSLDEDILNEMARIIEALDTPTSQVLLEIRILQLTLDDGFESFFDAEWTGTKGALGMLGSGALGSTTLDYLFGEDRIDARIALYENEGRAEIIATPFLMAANNSKVEFFVGEETPLRDDVTTTTTAIGDEGDTMTTFEVDIIREELGTDVEMTTFINEDGTVTLEFEAEISSAILNYSTVQVVNEKTGDIIDFPLDAKSTSEIKSVLSAKSGQSIAIGGIIKETLDLQETKVPVLGDVPGLGFFFKNMDNAKKKTETVIVLTPHVIRHPAMAGAVTKEFLKRKSSHEQITGEKENILEDPEDGDQ